MGHQTQPRLANLLQTTSLILSDQCRMLVANCISQDLQLWAGLLNRALCMADSSAVGFPIPACDMAAGMPRSSVIAGFIAAHPAADHLSLRHVAPLFSLVCRIPLSPAPPPAPKPLLGPPVPPMPTHQLPISAHSPLGRQRTASHFAPSERPTSNLSYASHATNAIDDILNSYDPKSVPATPLSPNMPVSPTTIYTPTTPGRFSRFSRFTTIFEDVVHMKVMPVYFAKGAVTKTAA